MPKCHYDRVRNCGVSCRARAARRTRTARIAGTTAINSQGYAYVHGAGRSNAGQHVLIAEKVLGRRLKSTECVHHINGDKTDNRNSNLLICSRSYHMSLHRRMGQLYQQEHFRNL
jgi:hypothetical protein